MSLPHPPDVHHLHRPVVACLACQRARRSAGDWPPPWSWSHNEPWSWGEAERSCWAPEWAATRRALGWPA